MEGNVGEHRHGNQDQLWGLRSSGHEIGVLPGASLEYEHGDVWVLWNSWDTGQGGYVELNLDWESRFFGVQGCTDDVS